MEKEGAIETINFAPINNPRDDPQRSIRRSQEEVSWKFNSIPATSASSTQPARPRRRNNISFEVVNVSRRTNSALLLKTMKWSPTKTTLTRQPFLRTTKAVRKCIVRNTISEQLGSAGSNISRPNSWTLPVYRRTPCSTTLQDAHLLKINLYLGRICGLTLISRVATCSVCTRRGSGSTT
jgi:hypothetical protein